MSLITLTTDFGLSDWFVGTMKGVVLGIAPRATIVDVTHDIPAGNVRSGAFVLRSAVPYFPKGSIHVVVVDPGVGTGRASLAVRMERSILIGPDNGVLTLAMESGRVKSVRRIENRALCLPEISRTFQGRDVFAPVAAHLSRGVSYDRVGPEVNEFIRLRLPDPMVEKGWIRGEVVYTDRFGNGITNLNWGRFKADERGGRARVGRRRVVVGESYQSVPEGRAVLVPGSTGYWEVAVNGGNAAERLGLREGDRVQLGSGDEDAG
ncbi:MAG TPA: SAM-dependent chlorinase/fluorinase [Methylomirabilota bacterium]|nr:SAM-dependent chlorinase/fluorinase [Methylomirabilota bacterium]